MLSAFLRPTRAVLSRMRGEERRAPVSAAEAKMALSIGLNSQRMAPSGPSIAAVDEDWKERREGERNSRGGRQLVDHEGRQVAAAGRIVPDAEENQILGDWLFHCCSMAACTCSYHHRLLYVYYEPMGRILERSRQSDRQWVGGMPAQPEQAPVVPTGM